MLDNIIGQKNTVKTLRQELLEQKFPQAVLFYGPPFSAKMSTALEVARILTCEAGTGEWSCGCSSCRKQRLLTHPYTLLLGSRYFDIEIAATADVLRRTKKLPAQFLFIRAVRKLTRRFDPVIWEGNEAKVRSLQPVVAEIEERLDLLSPAYSPGPHELPGEAELEDGLEKIKGLCRKLTGRISTDNIPIDHIRRTTYWMHTTAAGGAGGRKIIILENADKMYDASSNSLLKILEEPPTDVYLILITSRKGALIPTVRSRLRPYTFIDRDSVETAEVLNRIFHESADRYESLREYLLFWKDLNPDHLKALAGRFIDSILKEDLEEVDILEDMSLLFSTDNTKEFLASFMGELTIQFQTRLKQDSISPYLLVAWNRAVQVHNESLDRFNQNPKLALESLYYHLREIP